MDLRHARFEILGTRRPGRNSKPTPATGHVAYSEVPEIVRAAGSGDTNFDGGDKIDVDGFFGDVDQNIEALRRLANSLADRRVEASATRIIDYGGADLANETFHAKSVLADGVAAYVGSANLLRRSKSTNLECGMIVEGPAVGAVKVLLDAVTAIAGL